MTKQAPTVESMLAWLRDPQVNERASNFEILGPIHARMCSAIADWIDASRSVEGGSYEEGLRILDSIVHTFPSPPRDDRFEELVASLTGEEPSEEPKPISAADAKAAKLADESVQTFAVDLYDTESHKDLPPYVQKLVRELRADMGLDDTEEN